MKRSVLISVLAILAATALVVVGAVSMLRGQLGSNSAAPEGEEGAGERSTVTNTVSEIEAGSRPDCPTGTVGGVELPCLGATSADGAVADDQVTVVSLWAWWCEPCREELPALQEFADAHPEYSVVGVHADGDAQAGAALLDELGVTLPSYQDTENLFAAQLKLPPVVPVLVVLRGQETAGVVPTPFTDADDIAAAVEEVL
ncbi:TlpA disulfide reductase family protein [Corynebacterium sp. CCUG 70398]|uniref:TlpA family protein disulfide reductase n=1 Tax=Corynebacterium sp. CCUG 70398 TaxID=2823891 RepID=UPI00210F0856|nr:TlpA family protein disulfide reductase [Corynebacterium sp. CCUG 70398]